MTRGEFIEKWGNIPEVPECFQDGMDMVMLDALRQAAKDIPADHSFWPTLKEFMGLAK